MAKHTDGGYNPLDPLWLVIPESFAANCDALAAQMIACAVAEVQDTPAGHCPVTVLPDEFPGAANKSSEAEI